VRGGKVSLRGSQLGTRLSRWLVGFPRECFDCNEVPSLRTAETPQTCQGRNTGSSRYGEVIGGVGGAGWDKQQASFLSVDVRERETVSTCSCSRKIQQDGG